MAGARAARGSARRRTDPRRLHRTTGAYERSRIRVFEQCGIDWRVDLDFGDFSLERDGTGLAGGGERNLHAVDGAVVRELLFDDWPAGRLGGEHLLADQVGRRIDVEDDRVQIGAGNLERVIDVARRI